MSDAGTLYGIIYGVLFFAAFMGGRCIARWQYGPPRRPPEK